MEITLSKPQNDFITSNSSGTIFLSCIGGGKSYALVLKAILNALSGIRTLFVSYSVANLKDNILPIFYEIFSTLGLFENTDYKVVKSPHITVTLIGDDNKHCEILLRTGSHPDRLRGLTVGSFLIDEARELYSKEIFDILVGRLRQPGINNLQWGIGTTTRSQDWVYDLIKDEGLLNIFDDKQRIVASPHLTVIRTTIDEVPHLPKQQVELLKRTYSSRFALQELYAIILDDTGDIISPEWFTKCALLPPKSGVRYWDLAVTTSKDSDYSCGCLMSKIKNGDDYFFNIHSMKRVKLRYPDLKKLIISTAYEDGKNVTIGLEKAGQQTAIIDDLKRSPELKNFTIRYLVPTKDKVTRCYPWASQAELGKILINDQPFVKPFFKECTKFTPEAVKRNLCHDDMIDSVSGAFEMLSRSNKLKFTRFMSI